eukprot:COSAG02_NODE_23434_length_719_cov_0.583871_1_plen_56_part_10
MLVKRDSHLYRIFCCQFINYIVLVFHLNSSILYYNDLPGKKYDNINSNWYAQQDLT